MVGTIEETWPVIAGLHAYLGTLDADLLGASVMDIVGQRTAPHIRGAGRTHPNWSVVLQDGSEEAVLVEELAEHPGFAQIANALNEAVARPASLAADRPGTRPEDRSAERTAHTAGEESSR